MQLSNDQIVDVVKVVHKEEIPQMKISIDDENS